MTPDGPEVITRFPADDLLVTGRTYVRGIDIVDGHAVHEGNGSGELQRHVSGTSSLD